MLGPLGSRHGAATWPTMTSLRFVLCDVFTDQPLAGHTLAVFTRATGLSEERMQALARELNASETTFVQPPSAGGHAKLRVFDSAGEVLQPGHALLGTAVVLGGALQAEEVRLETPRGPASVWLEREGARIVFGWVHEPLPPVAPFEAGKALTDALGFEQTPPPSDVSECAPGHVVVATSLERLLALAPDRQELARLGVEFLCVHAGDGAHYRARVFAPAHDRFESPVTPRTAAAMAAELMRRERVLADSTLLFESLGERARPSIVHVRTAGSSGTLAVGGAAVVVGRGELVI